MTGHTSWAPHLPARLLRSSRTYLQNARSGPRPRTTTWGTDLACPVTNLSPGPLSGPGPRFGDRSANLYAMWLICSSRCGGALFRALATEVEIDAAGAYQSHRILQP